MLFGNRRAQDFAELITKLEQSRVEATFLVLGAAASDECSCQASGRALAPTHILLEACFAKVVGRAESCVGSKPGTLRGR